MIYIKTDAEIEKMKLAGKITAAVFDAVEPHIKPGISTAELDKIAYKTIVEAGAKPAFLGYGEPPFPGTACISLNDEVVHGIPSEKRILADGDIVSVDVGAVIDGFYGDACRTFTCGNVSDEAKDLIRTCEDSFWLAIREARIGNRIGDISATVQEFVESKGYGIVRELTGHGIGRHLHEDPDLLNYGRRGRGARLVKGMCLALEPMITQGSYDIKLLSDQWTISTRDGKLSAHYENSFAILEDGPYILTCPGFERPLAADFKQPKSYSDR
ncbi:MAG: type I methionyl aminopeptidase [Eubacteriales bacterium]|nr:type I methionyl aminopeptidase [Eubacteriales bacterium]